MARNWFVRPTSTVDAATPAAGVAAYQEGRRDERLLAQKTDTADRADRIEHDKAYDRGVKEGRRQRRGSGLGFVITLLLFALVVGAGVLLIHEGSFALAGAAVDQSLSTFSDRAQAPVRDAADKTGDALQNAGADLKQKAGTGAP